MRISGEKLEIARVKVKFLLTHGRASFSKFFWPFEFGA
jgi:hypothetical protein